MIRFLVGLFFFLAVLTVRAEVQVHGAIVNEDRVLITWGVDTATIDYHENLIIRYQRSSVFATEGEVWQASDTVPVTRGFYEIKNLHPSTTYIYQIGHLPKGETKYKWTPTLKFETKMPWGPTRLLFVIGALSLFIFGMKTMSEGIQSSAGIHLRQILESMTRSRIIGVLSGLLLTAVLQSSSATTVMTVSFVNAGLLSLGQSAGIMMGANVGTTLTSWIISLLGFRVDITIYALGILAISAPLVMMRRLESRSVGTALIGFALMFLGLGFLKETVPTILDDTPVMAFFMEYAHIPVLGVLLMVALGCVVTIILQSSSTTIALTMALCATGVIPFEPAAGIVLGSNIGTTTTAEIAARVGNIHAKRSARIHTLFNLIGAAWMIFLIPYVLILIAKILPANPFSGTHGGNLAATTGLAAFHTIFNVANLLFLFWFVPQLVNLSKKMLPSRSEKDEKFKLEYIDTSIQISEISLVEVKQELIKFGSITLRMAGLVRKLLTETEDDAQKDMHKRIKRYEEMTDRMEVEIVKYCARLSRMELSIAASQRLRAVLNISNNLESLADVFRKMSRAIERKSDEKTWFTPEQRINLLEMFNLINKALNNMQHNLEKDESETIDLEYAKHLERELNEMRNELKREYIKSVETGTYNMRSGTVYSDLFSSLEKAGDYIINVTEALVGKV